MVLEKVKLFNIGTWYKDKEKKVISKERNETTKNKKGVKERIGYLFLLLLVGVDSMIVMMVTNGKNCFLQKRR